LKIGGTYFFQGWTIGVLGLDGWWGLGIFLIITASRTALGPTQPPIQWVPGAVSLGVKLLGRQADHSPPSSAAVKNEWSYTPLPQYAFMAWCSVKAQGQLYLYHILKQNKNRAKWLIFLIGISRVQHVKDFKKNCCNITYNF
jgi:hypothetical protein